jgi:hypothetical protein
MERRSNDPIKAGVRQSKRQRGVGVGAACVDCGDTRAEMLVRRSRPKRCLKCYAIKKGKKPTERHHIAGEANSPTTVEIPITDHRKLSDAQYEWPPGVGSNPDGSPLLAAAGFLSGAADFVEILIVNGIRYIADFLRKLDAWLREHAGQKWWKGTEFDGWQPA